LRTRQTSGSTPDVTSPGCARKSDAGERRSIEHLAKENLHADRLLFSIKESVFKAWYPLTKRWIGFDDSTVTINPDNHTFVARLHSQEIEFAGRYTTMAGMLCTAIAVG
jgi:4'-phosphopantetheinyl transferase EntD